MKTLGRLFLFIAVTCIGGFLLAELSDRAPASADAATTNSTAEAAPEIEPPKTETATQEAPAQSAHIKVVKAHATGRDYKDAKDGKDFKDYAEPVAEGPEDAPALLGPPIFFMNPRMPGALAPAPLAPQDEISPPPDPGT